MREEADVIIVGAGLAGLVAATEVADAGKRVVVVDQEPEQSLGGQAFWSLGGLFLVDSPEQRRMRVRDSVNDRVSKILFEELAADEEGHIDFLETQLELVSQVGVQLYAQKHIGGLED